MDSVLMEFRRARPFWLIEPAIALIFLFAWINAEVGRGIAGAMSMFAFAVAIALTRRVPIASLVLIVLIPAFQALRIASAFNMFSATEWPVYLAIPIVVGLIAVHHSRRMTAIAATVGTLAVIESALQMVFQPNGWLSWTNDRPWASIGIIGGSIEASNVVGLSAVGVILTGLAVVGGRIAHRQVALHHSTRTELVVRLSTSEVELAVAQERNRIAQEMHDVLAHSLAVIVAQADGARYLRKTRPAAVESALGNIADSARSALVDVRGMIDGMLDGVESPQPSLTQLDDLVASVRRAGLRIESTSAGASVDLAAGQQVAVYRIVQEGLTNALRHRGRGSSVSLVLDWRGPGLSVQLVSSGEGEATASPSTCGGRGISGMIERARLAGGWLAAGLDENDDHRITAFIPFRPGELVIPALVAAPLVVDLELAVDSVGASADVDDSAPVGARS